MENQKFLNEERNRHKVIIPRIYLQPVLNFVVNLDSSQFLLKSEYHQRLELLEARKTKFQIKYLTQLQRFI